MWIIARIMMDGRQELMLFGSENLTFGDKICALVMALAPLLQHYKGIVQNAGFTVLLLITPILLIRTFNKLDTENPFMQSSLYSSFIYILLLFVISISCDWGMCCYFLGFLYVSQMVVSTFLFFSNMQLGLPN